MKQYVEIMPYDHLNKIASEFRDKNNDISPIFIERLLEAIEEDDVAVLDLMTGGLFRTDLGDVLSVLDDDNRLYLVNLLGSKFDFSSLTDIDDYIRLQLIGDLSPDLVAYGIQNLDSDDISCILGELEEEEQEKILSFIPTVQRCRIKRALRYPDQSAGRLMQTELVAIPLTWSVGQAVDYCREFDDLPDEFYEVYVLGEHSVLCGSVTLCQLLKSKREAPITSIVNENLHTVGAYEDREEAAYISQHYNLISLPVVDDIGRLLGVIMADDIMDVVEEEVDEDLRALVGLGDEEISASVVQVTRGRFVWLSVNLLTAFLSAGVISLFEDVIREVVALAVLAPIVTSQGGNAATQTMTVAVRAIATRELGWFNLAKFITREALVGILNGIMFAILVGTTVWFLYHNLSLSFAISAAMIINLLVGALAGTLFPLTIDRLKGDPAVVSGTFVTTVTDCVGFFTILGIAGLLIGFR